MLLSALRHVTLLTDLGRARTAARGRSRQSQLLYFVFEARLWRHFHFLFAFPSSINLFWVSFPAALHRKCSHFRHGFSLNVRMLLSSSLSCSLQLFKAGMSFSYVLWSISLYFPEKDYAKHFKSKLKIIARQNNSNRVIKGSFRNASS